MWFPLLGLAKNLHPLANTHAEGLKAPGYSYSGLYRHLSVNIFRSDAFTHHSLLNTQSSLLKSIWKTWNGYPYHRFASSKRHYCVGVKNNEWSLYTPPHWGVRSWGAWNFNKSFITFSFLYESEMCPHSISEVPQLSRERFSGVKNVCDWVAGPFQPSRKVEIITYPGISKNKNSVSLVPRCIRRLLSTDMAASYKIGLTNYVYKKSGQVFQISDYRSLHMFSEQQ